MITAIKETIDKYSNSVRDFVDVLEVIEDLKALEKVLEENEG